MSRKLNMTNTALLGRASARAASLFGVDDDRSLRQIDLDRLEPNPHQPRRHFDPDALAALAESIQRHGLLQPICVREIDGERYQIIAGERRFRAVTTLGWQSVPAIVTQSDDPAALAMIENIQREDLDGLELAYALRQLLTERDVSHHQLGLLIGKSQAYVSRTLGILNLPQSILDEYSSHRDVPLSSMMIIAESGREADQVALWERAKTGLSVRRLQETRKALREAANDADAGEAPTITATRGDDGDTRVDRAIVKMTKTVRGLTRDDAGMSQSRRQALTSLREAIDVALAD